MDMNDLYLVVVRLRDWEFMAEASHLNAKKAVRGLAADLRDFYDDGQRSSAAHLMQQGAAAAGVAAIEDARPTECLELELAERRLELKRKAEDWEQSLVERHEDWRQSLMERQMALPLTIQRQKLELAATWVQCMQQVNPDWRADARLQLQAQDRLSSAFLLEPRLAIAAEPAQGAAQGLRLESASLTLKEVADSLRAEVGRHDDRFLLRAGRAAAQLYAERRGRPPGKHKEMHGGRVLDVNSYTEADRALLEEAVRSTIAGGSRPLTQFFAAR
jgi:hypothetical protein